MTSWKMTIVIIIIITWIPHLHNYNKPSRHFFGVSLMEKAKPSHNSSVSHRRRQKCKFCTFRDQCIFDEKNLCEFIQKHVLQTEKASWFAINGQTVNRVSYWVCHLRLLLEMNGFFLYPCHPTGLSFQLVDVLLYHGAYTTLREAIYLKSGKHMWHWTSHLFLVA